MSEQDKNSAAEAAQPASTDAKAKFEAWAKKEGTYDLRPAKWAVKSVGGRPYDGYVRPYLQDRTVHAYEGFCAALESARPAATSGEAPDLQQLKALALAATHGMGEGHVKAEAYYHAASPAVVLDLIARIEHEREVAASWQRTAEKKDRDWNEARMAFENYKCAERAAVSAATKPTERPEHENKDVEWLMQCAEEAQAHPEIASKIRSAARVAATKPAAQAVPFTEDQVVAAARAWNNRNAAQCGINADDSWAIYGNDCIDDVRDVIRDLLAAAPLSADAAQEQAPREVWSNNNEDFNFDTLDELLDDGDYKPGDTVWVGEAVKPDLNELIDADDVVDQMADRAGDIAGDHADGYPEVSKDDKRELDGLLSDWIARRCPPNFYRVENVRPYRLSADDFLNDPTPLNAVFGAGAEGAA